MLIAGNALTATNLYAYANGNPVMLVDPDGELGRLFRAVVNVGTAVVQFACDLAVAGATAAVSVVTGQATVIEAGKQFVSDVGAATNTLVTSVGQAVNTHVPEAEDDSGTTVAAKQGTPAGAVGGLQQAEPESIDFAAIIWSIFAPLLDLMILVLSLFVFGSTTTYIRQVELQNIYMGNIKNNPHYVIQGFAIGSDFAYSFEVANNDTLHRLYQYHIDNKTLTQMTSSQTIELGHANDVTLAAIGGEYYMFVAVNSNRNPVIENNPFIAKLKYSGSTYTEVARYYYPPGIRFSGISSMGHVDTDGDGVNDSIKLLLKLGTWFSTVVIPHNLPTSSLLNIEHQVFRINLGTYADYIHQAVHYDRTLDKIYVNYWGGTSKRNESVILVYNNINTASGNINYRNAYVMRKGNDTSVTFEIEGLGFRSGNSTDNRLWFSVYEGNATNGGIYTDSRSIK